MKRGDKVRTVYGTIETVMRVEPLRVFTYESFGWYHPTKVFPVFWSKALNHYVTIPE